MRKDIMSAVLFTATGAAMGVGITFATLRPCAPVSPVSYAAMVIEPRTGADAAAIVEPLEDRLNRGISTAPVGI